MAPPTPFLLRFVCVSPTPQHTRRPHPIVVWMWFYFLSVSPALSPLSNPSAPSAPPPVVSCSFLGFCTTQLVYTVYTRPAKRKPNSKHFIGRLEWLCPACGVWRPWAGWGRSTGGRSGTGMWLFWTPGRWLGWRHCIHDFSLCNKEPTPKFSGLKQAFIIVQFLRVRSLGAD